MSRATRLLWWRQRAARPAVQHVDDNSAKCLAVINLFTVGPPILDHRVDCFGGHPAIHETIPAFPRVAVPPLAKRGSAGGSGSHRFSATDQGDFECKGICQLAVRRLATCILISLIAAMLEPCHPRPNKCLLGRGQVLSGGGHDRPFRSQRRHRPGGHVFRMRNVSVPPKLALIAALSSVRATTGRPLSRGTRPMPSRRAWGASA